MEDIGYRKQIERAMRETIAVKEEVLADQRLMSAIAEVVDQITSVFRSGHRVFFCGNGGSAADAQHLAAEFCGRFFLDRAALPSEALHCNSSYLTAVANDYGFEKVYARLITGVARKGDMLVGLSTSGNSENVVEAMKVCKELGVSTVAMTGRGGGAMREVCDIWLGMPAESTPRIQEAHITVGHIVCELVERNLFAEKR